MLDYFFVKLGTCHWRQNGLAKDAQESKMKLSTPLGSLTPWTLFKQQSCSTISYRSHINIGNKINILHCEMFRPIATNPKAFSLLVIKDTFLRIAQSRKSCLGGYSADRRFGINHTYKIFTWVTCRTKDFKTSKRSVWPLFLRRLNQDICPCMQIKRDHHPHTNTNKCGCAGTRALIRHNISLTHMPHCPQEILHETIKNENRSTYTHKYFSKLGKPAVNQKCFVCVWWGERKGGQRGMLKGGEAVWKQRGDDQKKSRLTERDKRETKSWGRRFRGSSEAKLVEWEPADSAMGINGDWGDNR